MKVARTIVEKEQINLEAEYPDSYVYVIRRYPGAGFFSDFFYVLSHMEYAMKKWGGRYDLKIVIDMENYDTLYKEDEEIDGITNQWEYYFRQPSGIKLSDLNDYGHVIFSANGFKPEEIPLYAGSEFQKVFPNKCIVEKINRLYLPMIPFSPKTKAFISEGKEIFMDGKVLGIHMRGTDMMSDPTHPNPFMIEDLIRFIKERKIDEKYTSFFVCGDTEKYMEIMKEKFPGKIYVLDALRATDDTITGIHKQKNSRDRNKYKMGLEVIKDMEWLSMCDGLICSHSNVAYAAIVYNNNKYKDLFVWNGDEYDKI
jgi:hypothetical protein